MNGLDIPMSCSTLGLSKQFDLVPWSLLMSRIVLAIKGCNLESVTVDIGSNVSFPCEAQGAILWVREGQWINPSQDSMVDAQGTLHLLRVRTSDAGLYECQSDSPDNYSHPCQYMQRVNLTIRTPPPALNVTVHPSTVLALVMWHVVDDGGHSLTSIHVQYRETEDPKGAWLRTIPDRVGPATNIMEIYNLQPNTSYSFRVWAVNALGPGIVTEVNATTKPAFDDAGTLFYFGAFLLVIFYIFFTFYVPYSSKFNPKVWLTAVLCVLIVFGVGLSALAFFYIQEKKTTVKKNLTSCVVTAAIRIVVSPLQSEYDRGVNTFSPEGRLFQVG
nr:EOG090X0B8X [Triops cancriformis]